MVPYAIVSIINGGWGQMRFNRRLALTAALLLSSSSAVFAQTVTPLADQTTVQNGAVYGFLMTDGSLLYQDNDLTDWWKYTPDQFGGYQNGTWTRAASLPSDYIPDATSGGVLADGRLLLIGGEYSAVGNYLDFTLTNQMAIYDPVADSWTEISPPAGWSYIGDSVWTILADGRLLLGDKINQQAAVLDAKTLTWTAVATPGKLDFNAEEGWTLMPDGSVLTVDVKNHPQTERFLPNADPTLMKWISAGATPVDLRASLTTDDVSIPYGDGQIYYPPGEVGPAILRPNGTVFATGAVCHTITPPLCVQANKVGHTAIYHPGRTPTATGTWTAGPDFPGGVGAGDAFAALLPNGHVLVTTNPQGTDGDTDLTTLEERRSRSLHRRARAKGAIAIVSAAPNQNYQLFEFDGVNLNAEQVAIAYAGGSLLLLPSGQVMMDGIGLYTSPGGLQEGWRPVIAEAPKTVQGGSTYTISGRQFNGLSQANAMGDEFTVATNFPLVRITNIVSGHVTYARTHDHSSMGVATGNLLVSTQFDVPAGIEPGKSRLEVVANGIASWPIPVTVQ